MKYLKILICILYREHLFIMQCSKVLKLIKNVYSVLHTLEVIKSKSFYMIIWLPELRESNTDEYADGFKLFFYT